MASPPKYDLASADDDLDRIPIRKTNPLVLVAIAVGVLLIGGVGAYSMFGGNDQKPKEDMAAALHSARVAAEEAKAKQVDKERHLELAAKAWAVASEKERAAAAASAASEVEPEAKPGGGTPGGGTPGGGTPGGGTPGAGRSKPRGPSGNELNELDKLGSETNSELGGK